MSEEFKSCGEVLMGVLDEMERQYEAKIHPTEMSVSVDWKSRTARFDPIGYEIDLTEIGHEDTILEWIEHLSEKSWISVKLLAEFSRAARTNLQWMRARQIA